MKKLSLLIALCMLLTISGVYATWTYTQNTDVADETVHLSLNLTSPAYSGSYGTYEINADGMSLTIDPKAGTTHTTALYATGNIVIKFTPNSVAPSTVKENAIPSTYKLTLANTSWQYEGQNIITINHSNII